jgi:hypothetical protein
MKISRTRLKEIIKGVMTEESEYQAFFQKALDKAGKSIPSMSDEEKKAFFDKIDAAWNGKGEKNEELVGGQKKLDKNHNGKIDGQDFKILKGQKKSSKKCDDCGKEVKDCKCDQSHLEESPNFGKKVTKGHNGIPEFMDSKKLKGESEKTQVKEWVEKLVENQYHSFTSKNEIMELIKVKINENQPAPSKPTRETPVREKPSTKPEKPSRENPFEPKHKPKPKALGEDEQIGDKTKMPEFMKSKNLGFKFKDQK